MDYNSKRFKTKRMLFTFAYPAIFSCGLALLFYVFGGGQPLEAKENSNKKGGFDTSITNPSKTEIVDSKQAAYEEQEKIDKKIPADFNFGDVDVSRDDSKPPEIGSNGTPNSKNNANRDVNEMYKEYNSYYKGNNAPAEVPSAKQYSYNPSSNTNYKKPTRQAIENIGSQATNDGQELQEKTVLQEQTKPKSLFFGSKSNQGNSNVNTIDPFVAVIHGDQLIGAGSVVKMRTIQPGTLKGSNIPTNTFIYGVAQVNNQGRVNIIVNSLKVNNQILSCSMRVFDYGDGQSGIFVAGGDLKGQVNEEIDQVNVNSGSNIPVIGTVTDAAKALFKKKATKSQVLLGSNYRVLIKE